MPWHLAFVPSKKLPRCRPSGLAPKITKFLSLTTLKSYGSLEKMFRSFGGDKNTWGNHHQITTHTVTHWHRQSK